MDHIVNVKDIIGVDFTCTDAILLKENIKSNLKDTVVLDFHGLNKVPTTFFYTLLSDIIYDKGRSYIFEHVKVKNLTNHDDFNMVLLGAAQNLN